MIHSGRHEPMGPRKPPTKKQLEERLAAARDRVVAATLRARETWKENERAELALAIASDEYKAAMAALEEGSQ